MKVYGAITLTLLGSNTWLITSNISADATTAALFLTSYGIALGSALDRIRIRTVNGTDTFDAGSINIMYE